MNKGIRAYNASQTGQMKKICVALAKEIDAGLKGAESKIWHGGPVWFLDGNPIVGYWVRKNGTVQVLFWSGQSFDESGLKDEGSFKAAEACYATATDIKATDLRRWLRKSKKIQWNYKDIVKNRGKLSRL